jgi:hypothetical protein
VGLEGLDKPHDFGLVAGFPDNRKLRLGLEQLSQAIPENGARVGHHKANKLRTRRGSDRVSGAHEGRFSR